MENNLKTFYRFTTMLDFLSFDYLNNQNETEKTMFYYEHFYSEEGDIGAKFISIITPKCLGFHVEQKKHIIKNVKVKYVFLNNDTLELNISLNFRNLTQAELSLFEIEHRKSIHSFIQDIIVGNIDFSKDYNIQYLTENICNDFRENNFIFDKDFEDYMELTYGK
tara:strand:+ start:17240 stop:17734 length:495 start_codon:yes stop_codon:yes gene_type:complete